MKAKPTPRRFRAEEARLEALWLALPEEVSYEDVVKEHGTEEYKDYYFGEMAKKKELRKQGIIIN